MKTAQQNTNGWISNPFNYDQSNHAIYTTKEKIIAQTHSNKLRIGLQATLRSTIPRTTIKYSYTQKQHPFFTDETFSKMNLGKIPNFEYLYHSFLKIEKEEGESFLAIEFLKALRNFSLSKGEIKSLMNNPESNHVLVENNQIKIIVIRWKPNELSSIHGHAIGGCLVKVLHGEIEEKRYAADNEQQLLSKSTYFTDHIAYIDDVMGLHSVGNAQDFSALTLHLYTPGKKQLILQQENQYQPFSEVV